MNPFEDPRLAGLYDRDNPDGPDRDFYRRLADDIDARRIVDLGCGTGLLTCSLATSGRTVIGIDPAAAMLDIARRRAGNVSWIHGDAGDLPGNDADLALMTANVAQVFTTDPEWARTLDGLRRALRAGGTLAFESRNPDARAWETWGALRRVETLHGPLTRRAEKIHERDGLVTYDAHTVSRRPVSIWSRPVRCGSGRPPPSAPISAGTALSYDTCTATGSAVR